MEIKTTKELLATCYFNGFNVVLRDNSEINKKWIAFDDLIQFTQDEKNYILNIIRNQECHYSDIVKEEKICNKIEKLTKK